MLNEPNWLPLNEIVEINREAVQATNEPFHVRDIGLVESALHKPKHHWQYNQPDLADLAVQLFLGLAQNHGFAQGNKRTGWTAAIMFLEINGYELQAKLDSDQLGELLTRIVEKKIPADPLAKILRAYVRPLNFE